MKKLLLAAIMVALVLSGLACNSSEPALCLTAPPSDVRAVQGNLYCYDSAFVTGGNSGTGGNGNNGGSSANGGTSGNAGNAGTAGAGGGQTDVPNPSANCPADAGKVCAATAGGCTAAGVIVCLGQSGFCRLTEVCGNGVDDDCDSSVDESACQGGTGGNGGSGNGGTNNGGNTNGGNAGTGGNGNGGTSGNAGTAGTGGTGGNNGGGGVGGGANCTPKNPSGATFEGISYTNGIRRDGGASLSLALGQVVATYSAAGPRVASTAGTVSLFEVPDLDNAQVLTVKCRDLCGADTACKAQCDVPGSREMLDALQRVFICKRTGACSSANGAALGTPVDFFGSGFAVNEGTAVRSMGATGYAVAEVPPNLCQ